MEASDIPDPLFRKAVSAIDAGDVSADVDLNAFNPPGFHEHGTALHHAVDSGSLAAVKVLVEAGAELGTRDRVHQGTPLDWAEHEGRTEIAAYLREKEDQAQDRARHAGVTGD